MATTSSTFEMKVYRTIAGIALALITWLSANTYNKVDRTYDQMLLLRNDYDNHVEAEEKENQRLRNEIQHRNNPQTTTTSIAQLPRMLMK